MKAMKLLAIRLDSAGDVLMCGPALRALHEHGHQLTLLTSPAGALAGARIEGIADVLSWQAPWMKASAPADAGSVPTMAKQLRDCGFDGAVIFTSYSQSALPAALLCQMAGIPLRLAHCRENPYQLLTHWVRETEPSLQLRHEVQRQVDLVSELGCRPASMRLSVRIDDADRAAARAALQAAGINPAGDWILLHPGASAPARRYPAERWHAAACLLEGQLQRPLLFAGGNDDIERVDAIVNTITQGQPEQTLQRWPSVAGRLDFGALAALIAMARVLVACNSAPAHLAAAVGTPVVDLYALTNPQHTPWQVLHRLLYRSVPCHDCGHSICPLGHQRCLSAVEPREILQAVQELLQTTDADQLSSESH